MAVTLKYEPSGALATQQSKTLGKLLLEIAPDLATVRAVSFFVDPQTSAVTWSLVGERSAATLDDVPEGAQVLAKKAPTESAIVTEAKK